VRRYLRKENKIYSVIILDNNWNNAFDILRFNYSDLAKDFEKPILMKLDINNILYLDLLLWLVIKGIK
jgi:hypothetical protein